MMNENMVKVGLPGESLWAEVLGTTDAGRIRVALRNESIHDGIHWDDRAVLAADGYTIEEPSEMVRMAEESCERLRRGEAHRD